jgi:drug/metabolite transporter (DMT)-like permease
VTFAGLRYALAFLCLLPLAARSSSRLRVQGLSRRRWLELAGLGVLFYALTQGASFVSLAYLPAMTVSLLWNLTTITVAMLGIRLLTEPLTAPQWGGVLLNLLGVLIYFFPAAFRGGEFVGLAAAFVGVLANAGSSVLGRSVNRRGDLAPIVVTAISMGIGAALLLATGLLAQGLPALRVQHWLIIGWLAAVNTAFAFTLWNRTLRTLTAVESSIINSTMLGQIALLALFLLGETLTWQKAIGIALAALGTLIVNLRWAEKS